MQNIYVDIRDTPKGKGLFAKKNIAKNTEIFKFEKRFVKKSSNTTLRIDMNLHQESKNPDAFENFANHSCNPSAYIDWNNLSLRVIRDVTKDEEITYNYFTSDWDNEDVFDCKCGCKSCHKKINGFKNLKLSEKEKLKRFLSPFLKRKLKEEINKINKK